MTTPAGRGGVLMVTGAYLPELSGGGLQCRTMIHALRETMRFEVLTTCTDPALPGHEIVEGIPVTRVFVDVRRWRTKVAALVRVTRFFIRHHARFAVVHLHGYSQKSAAIILLARLFGKKTVLTIHTAGHDEASGARAMGRVASWGYGQVDRYVAISTRLARNYLEAGLPPERLHVAPNGLDITRFRPPEAGECEEALHALGLRDDVRWILFVGFFSREKAPDVLFEAWLRLRETESTPTGLLLVGATEGVYHEVDATLARDIQARAAALGLTDLVRITGPRADIERAYHAADVLAMPSTREAFGMVLVEAMASGLPVVATRLEGVTDEIVEDGVTGWLVPPRDPEALSEVLARVCADSAAAQAMGARGREAVVARYGLEAARTRWLSLYRGLAP
ncbi:MAG: glycosyltransferase family 4 protein [Vicinamibacterales bacterium]|nr:glycosyltransferase family 4 protein [Vicinamibacterales bacterium]